MCGICGILAAKPTAAELENANALLIQRGPDDAGIYLDEQAGLAARRLSIVDIAGGHQPLHNEDRSLWLVCNGEIVNAPELRDELEKAGHIFYTHSDAETILHASEAWGDEATGHLRGMFAFAVWDTRRRRLTLGRDRFGMKPLYYASAAGRFAFASTARAVLQLLPGLPRRANLQALWQLFEVGFVPNPQTAFEGIHELPPAHMLTIEEGGQPVLRRYWQLHYLGRQEPYRGDMRHASQEFIARLIEALRAWRMSDVPIGSLLSGGVDSASVATLFSEINSAPIDTFNIGFSGWERDETQRASETARQINSRHHQINFSLQDFDHLPETIRRLEEPQCSATSIMLYLLYRSCHQAGFKVVLTGEGSDELLGGYPWYQGDQRVRPFLGLPAAGRAWVWRLATPLLRGSRRALLHGTPDPVQRFTVWLEADRPRGAQDLFNFAPQPSITRTWQEQYRASLQGLHPLHQFQTIEQGTRLVDYINLNMDSLSMAHSVEARPPFLDHLLWEFTARLPPGTKINWRENKRLLRQGLDGRLPEAVRKRPKLGLTAPEVTWWRSERLPDWAEELLAPQALAQSGYFKPGEVQRLRQIHQRGYNNASRTLTGILTTQIWHFEFLQA